MSAKQSSGPTNGDGFGVGWYDQHLSEPCLFKSVEPAWNDHNLSNLSRHIKSGLFLAHVRATTGTPVQKSNCHPFYHQNWMFVHNGYVKDYRQLRRDMAIQVQPELFPSINGTTDSELMFYLALTFGLPNDPKSALESMVGFLEILGERKQIENPVHMTLGISDGRRLIAVRYSSQGSAPSLYYSTDVKAIKKRHPEIKGFSDDARAIVSEPLGDLKEFWHEVPESSFVMIDGAETTLESFNPQVPDI